jgi:hypothetical protein
MKKIFGSAFLALIVLSSCEKDKDDCPTDVVSLSGTYKLTAATVTIAGTTTDEYAAREACEKDDLYILAADGSLTYQDAGTACNPSGSYSSTWSVSGNTITIDGETFTIESFDCDNLKVTASGLGYSAKATFNKQ